MTKKKYLIVGGVAGGASTAARLRRLDEHAEIIIFERGSYISYANCGLPYYLGGVIQDRAKLLVQTAEAFKARFNVDVRVASTVTRIDRAGKMITVLDMKSGQIYTEHYDKLILSPGAAPIRPNVPGVNSEGIFTLRSVSDTDLIKEYISNKSLKRAVVIGAGYIGMEMAENLSHAGLDVTVVEKASTILPVLDFQVAATVQNYIRSKNIQLILNNAVTGFSRLDGELTLSLAQGPDIKTDLVIVSIGVRAESELAQTAGLFIGSQGGIIVDEYLQTSDRDIYAVGDAIEFVSPITGKPIPTYLAGPASKQGRICANNIVQGNKHKFNGSINSAIVKIFDMTVGIAGSSSAALKASKVPHIVSTTHGNSHSTYYPDSKRLSIHITFSPDNGKLLGAQVVGMAGVDKRLDVLASIIKRGGTIDEMVEFEQAYAPPFSAAKDAVNVAGLVADNIINGLSKVCYVEDVKDLADKFYVLDVRQPAEFEAGHIPRAANIPLPSLRSRIEEIPKGMPVLVYCQVGLRGYVAQRILLQRNFRTVLNLSGGYTSWKVYDAESTIA